MPKSIYQSSGKNPTNLTEVSISDGNLPCIGGSLQFPEVQGRKNPLWMGLPARLKRTRGVAHLSCRQLAALAGCGNSTVSAVETHGQVPGIDLVEKLAAALGISAGWLAFGYEGGETFQWRRPRAIVPLDDPEPKPAEGRRADGHTGCGERVRQCRENQGLTLRGLADRAAARSKLGQRGSKRAPLVQQTVAYIESGYIVPKLSTIEPLALALDVSPAWLAFGHFAGPVE